MPSRYFFYLALLLIALSFAQLFYRLSLPSEGWSFSRDATGSSMRLVFERNLTGQPSPLQSGDKLLAVEGQSLDQLLSGALTLTPSRPAGWTDGKVVQYTIQRVGTVLNVPVHLMRLPISRILLNAGRNLLISPGPLVMLLIALFVFSHDPQGKAARLLLLFSAAVYASDGVSQVISGTNVRSPTEMLFRGAYWPAQIMESMIWPFLIAPYSFTCCFPSRPPGFNYGAFARGCWLECTR